MIECEEKSRLFNVLKNLFDNFEIDTAWNNHGILYESYSHINHIFLLVILKTTSIYGVYYMEHSRHLKMFLKSILLLDFYSKCKILIP